jgi:hypothetical protein
VQKYALTRADKKATTNIKTKRPLYRNSSENFFFRNHISNLFLVLLFCVVSNPHVSVAKQNHVIPNILTYFWEQSTSSAVISSLSAPEISLLPQNSEVYRRVHRNPPRVTALSPISPLPSHPHSKWYIPNIWHHTILKHLTKTYSSNNMTRNTEADCTIRG